jgi:MtrB/PioB family decaheme-associated outer membrane protein
MRTRLLSLTAALLVASFGTARAQEPPTKPLPPSTPSNGVVDIGFRGDATKGDVARYERYRDLRDGAATLFSASKNTPTYRFSAMASNAGYHDQRYQATLMTARTNFTFLWDSIPTNFSYLTRTPWTDSGNGLLTLPASARQAVEAKVGVGVPCSAGGAPASCSTLANATLAKANRSIYVDLAKPFDMQMRRDSAGFEMSYAATQALGLNVGFTTTAKTGTQPWAASFAFSNVNEVALPLDQRAHDVTAGVEYANAKGMVRVGYDGSFFNNDIQTLTWDNPIRFTDFNNGLAPPRGPYDPSAYVNGNGAAVGQMALAPSNALNAVGVTALYKMPSRTTVNGMLRFTDMSQNEALLPWTLNTSINNPAVLALFPGLRALPRTTAEAQVHGWNALINLNSRPTDMLGFQVRYRFNKHDNLTPHFPGEEYVRFDGVPEETGGESEQFDITQDTLDASATLSLKSVAIRAGYGYDAFLRTGRSFADMNDRRFRLSVDTLRTQHVTVRAGYDYTQRRGNGFSEDAIEEGGSQPGLRFYDEADRNSHRTSLIFIVSPIGMIDLSATIGTSREEYKGAGHEFGLLNTDVDDYTVGVTVMPNDRTDLGLSWGRNLYSTLQKARNANPPPDPTWTDPARDWTLDNDETVNNVNAYVNLSGLYKEGELRVAWDFSDSDNAYLLGGPRTQSLAAAGQFIPMPNVTNRWNRVTVDYRIYVARNVGLGTGFWYEKLEISDFNTIDTNGPIGFAAATGVPRIDWLGGLMTGYGNRPYTGKTAFVRVLYRF